MGVKIKMGAKDEESVGSDHCCWVGHVTGMVCWIAFLAACLQYCTGTLF